jgi:hypothetical protein
MAVYPTNSLLDLCRDGVSTLNEKADQAAREVSSYIVFASLLKHETVLPIELEPSLDVLVDVKKNPANYSQDMFEEDEEPAVDDVSPEEPPPQVA